MPHLSLLHLASLASAVAALVTALGIAPPPRRGGKGEHQSLEKSRP